MYQNINNKKILSIDYGTKFIGLATYHASIDPFPIGFDRIKFSNEESVLKLINNVVIDECIDLIVLGLPLLLDGTESTMTAKVRAFGEKLKIATSKSIFFQDETLTTYEAKDRMQKSPEFNFKYDPSKIDVLSAIIILEDFLKGVTK
jgi:putative Holliday junction resolvase